MTEKIGLIKNPLTIIAIFAGIAEVSGTVVLPFISEENQELFIYFLICFPSILVLLFFVTLNFNNKVLYAPSDFKDETNYIKVNKYDISKQRNIELIVPKENQKDEHVIQLIEEVKILSNQVLLLDTKKMTEEYTDNIELPYSEIFGTELLVSNFVNAKDFIIYMQKIGLNFEIYQSPAPDEYDNSYSEHRAIWLGNEVTLELAKLVIKYSRNFYPHLRYIKISDIIDQDGDSIYIGGSTDSAVKNFKCLPLSKSDFEKIQSINELESLHNYINKFNKISRQELPGGDFQTMPDKIS